MSFSDVLRVDPLIHQICIFHEKRRRKPSTFAAGNIKSRSSNKRQPCRNHVGRDSSVGKAIRCRLECPGIESRWGEIFLTRLDRPWGPLLYNVYRVSPGGKAAGAWR
jgi:hypothetical protein